VELPVVAVVVVGLQGAVHLADRVAQQGIAVGGDTAVGMQLDEDPLGSSRHVNAGALPEADTIRGGRIDTGDLSILDAGQETILAPGKVEREGALDEEQ
jgi:hypothetical protein